MKDFGGKIFIEEKKVEIEWKRSLEIDERVKEEGKERYKIIMEE